MDWNELADHVLAGHELTKDEALDILKSDNQSILELMNGAYKIRQHYFQNKVKLNMIISTKTGNCPETCGYCAQSSDSTAPIEKYTMMTKEEIVAGAKRAHDLNSGTYCIVASGRGPVRHELSTVTEAVKEIKAKYEDMRVCACLGILREGQAEQLKEAGVDRYNHNINTSEAHHDSITKSHTYGDRVATVEKIKEAGISPCSGVIVGMKETKVDVYEMARALKEIDADSIPVNFLNAIDGTMLEGTDELTPLYSLKVLALFRYMNPTKEIRVSGGREVNLRTLQPLSLFAANSIFIGDYLTTDGQERNQDYKMIEDLGFEIDYENLEDKAIFV